MKAGGNPYRIAGEEGIESPALIYYRDIIEENLEKVLRLAGGADRLWPHVKTHKMEALVRMQVRRGIRRFKCATIAEAEMSARAGGEHILLSYPLVGPNIDRFIRLGERYGETLFYAIGDDREQLARLAEAARASGREIPVLIDVNLGMNRTGAAPEELEALCLDCAALEGIRLRGFHCYDGHFSIPDREERERAVEGVMLGLRKTAGTLKARGLDLPILVAGGTPTFPCHTGGKTGYLSPGTCFVQDWGYASRYPDLDFVPGAALLSRVVSHPGPGLFTLDLGYKAISTDQEGQRGIIVDLPEARPAAHSEEHWVFRLEGKIPPIGTVLYVLPAHICPTTALYPGACVASGGRLVDYWETSARDRRLSV
ncbi:MAG: D-TA family PLP-dependent enzyme [Treponema sp.]|jgi:D-serine deaminase-like pyridoxal phosphate-dependent protein|nr:D-TA family PLP-dependent enzyme [Treponema sp.]